MDKTEQEQLWKLFVAAAKERHVKEIISTMMKAHKDDKLTNDESKNKVVSGFQKAIFYGFSLDEHIIEFINLTFSLGEKFDFSEWAQEILSWKDTSNEAKIRALIAKSEHEMQTTDHRLQTTD